MQRFVLFTVLLVTLPNTALAFECGGGGEWLESEGGELCLFVAENDIGDPAETASVERRMLRYVARRRIPAHRRAIVAAAYCEIAAAQGRWEEAATRCSTASTLYLGYADTHGADATRAIALYRLGRRDEARQLANAFAARECDTFDGSTAYFDHDATCGRTYAVLTAIEPQGTAQQRLERFNRVRGTNLRRQEQVFAQCLVSGVTPCRRASTH